MQVSVFYGAQTIGTGFLELEDLNARYKAFEKSILTADSIIQNLLPVKYIDILVANNWYDEPLDGRTIIEHINTAFPDHAIRGYVLESLYKSFNGRMFDKNVTYEDVITFLTNEVKELVFFAAIKCSNFWVGIKEKLHVTDKKGISQLAEDQLSSVNEVDEEVFFKSIVDLFPNLVFSESFPNCLKTHGKGGANPAKGIKGFKRSVLSVLSALNHIPSLCMESTDGYGICSMIRDSTGFQCTPEGGNKKHLQIEGVADSKVNCEFHAKFPHSDLVGDSHRYNDRLYFGIGTISGEKKIYIHHCGEHL